MSPPLLLSKMAAERLRVSTKTLNGYVRDGDLKATN
jgi:predicted site-specific integrase-resolvase